MLNNLLSRQLAGRLSILFVLVFSLGLQVQTTTYAASTTVYSKQIDQTVLDLDKAVEEGLAAENLLVRSIVGIGNTTRAGVNFIPRMVNGTLNLVDWVPVMKVLPRIPLWARPFGRIRYDFYAAHKLLKDISDDPQLNATDKESLRNRLTHEIGTALEQFSSPFQDPQVDFLNQWKNVDNKALKVLALIGSRVAFFFYSAGIDFNEFGNPMSAKPGAGDGTTFHIPDTFPFIGDDSRRNSLGASVLRDAAIVFAKGLRDPERYPDQDASRSALLLALKNAEPIRYHEVQSFGLFTYSAGQVWFAINPQPELSLESTVLGPLLSAAAYVSLIQGLKHIHKAHSGYSIYEAYRRLNQPGTNVVGRIVRNVFNGTISNTKIFLGFSQCASELAEVETRTSRLSARRERVKQISSSRD